MLYFQSLLFVTWSWVPIAENKIKGNICVKCFRLNLIINFFLQLGFQTEKKSQYGHIYTCSFPGGTSGKEPACQCRKRKRHRFDPWVRKIPWRRTWRPTPGSLPGESHGQRSLVGYSLQGRKELDTTEWLSVSLSFLEAWGDKNRSTGGVRSPMGHATHCRPQSCVFLRDRGERWGRSLGGLHWDASRRPGHAREGTACIWYPLLLQSIFVTCQTTRTTHTQPRSSHSLLWLQSKAIGIFS